MKNIYLLLSFTLLIACSFQGTVEDDSQSLESVAEDFMLLVKDLNSGISIDEGKLRNPSLAKYNFDFIVVSDGFQIRVRNIRRFVHIGNALECSKWFQYSSNGIYEAETVVKFIGRWALIKSCRA